MPHGPFIRKKVRDILRPAAINELQAALENAPTLAEAGTVSTATQTAINTKLSPVPMASGKRYSCMTHGGGASAGPFAGTAYANNLSIHRIAIGATTTFTSVGVNVTAATAGGLLRLGLFSFNYATLVATLVADFGAVATDTAGEKTIVISRSIAAGELWLGLNANANIAVSVVIPAIGLMATGLERTADFQATVTYGALPATVTITSFSSTVNPIIWLGAA